jgi:hypothetical protein
MNVAVVIPMNMRINNAVCVHGSIRTKPFLLSLTFMLLTDEEKNDRTKD